MSVELNFAFFDADLLEAFLIIRSSISSSCWCAAVLISRCNLRLVSNIIFFFLLQCYLGNPEKKWKTSIPVTPAVCSHRIFYLKQAGTMTETTDCQEQRLTVVLLQYSIPSNQWFIQLLPQALFLLVHFLYNLITSQRNPLMLMEHLLYQNCLHPHLPSLHRKQREKVCMSNEIPSSIQDDALHYIACLKYVSSRI